MTIGTNLITWIIVGLIAGWLAGKVMRAGGDGLVGDIVFGVLGGLLGGYLASYFLHIKNVMSGINLESILVALAGAVLLLVGMRLLRGGRSRSSIFR